jgi:type VI protein secretion system component Hcp
MSCAFHFLKIQGVTGPVTNAAFVGAIQLIAYSQGFTDPATLASGGAASGGKTTRGAINITKVVDSTSPDFLQYVTRGVGIQGATIYFLGSANGATPANVPEKFTFTYRSVSPDGVAGKVESFTWDCATNSTT